MALPTRRCRRYGHTRRLPRRMQPGHKIRWDKGAIPRDRGYPGKVRPMRRRPFKTGQNARERPG
jgi:hypothetical protein